MREYDEEGRKRGRKEERKASRQGGTRALQVRAVHTPADGSRVSHATTWRQGSSRAPFFGPSFEADRKNHRLCETLSKA